MNERIAVDGVFTPNVSSGPDDDRIVKDVRVCFFTPAETKYFTTCIPNNNDRKCLDSRSVFFHFFSGAEIAVAIFAEVSGQFVCL